MQQGQVCHPHHLSFLVSGAEPIETHGGNGKNRVNSEYLGYNSVLNIDI